MDRRIGDLPSLQMIILTFQLLIFKEKNTKQTTNTRDLQPKFWNIILGNSWSFWVLRHPSGEISCTIVAVSTRAQRTNVANGNRWIMLCYWLAMAPKMDVTGIESWDKIDFPHQIGGFLFFFSDQGFLRIGHVSRVVVGSNMFPTCSVP